ncbi:hypothetical protein [Candidatus Pyrohabitans sp.]
MKLVLGFWKKKEDVTGYRSSELYQTNDDGTIVKLWIPLPWWDSDGGYFRVTELCFIHAPNLTQDVKTIKLEAAAELQFFAPDRIDTCNVFFIYQTRSGVRASFANDIYIYLIRENEHALRHILRLMFKAISSVHVSVKKARFIKPVTLNLLEASEEFISLLEKHRKGEIRKINQCRGFLKRNREEGP